MKLAQPDISIGAIDAGTTSVRFVLFDRRGRPLETASRPLPIDTPQPGWVEQDPRAIVDAAIDVVHDVLARPQVDADKVAAIGLANQRETVVVWDRDTGIPCHPAIVWQDRRTVDRCAALRDDARASGWIDRTGLPLDPYFSATKIEWLLDHVDGLRASAEAGRALFGTVDAWILWNLAGRHATDDTNASRTLLYSLADRRWDGDLLDLFGIPEACLPRIGQSLSRFGRVRPEVLDGLGSLDIPIAGVLGDQQASLLGQAITSPGVGQVTWGTGAFLLAPTGPSRVRSRGGLISTVARTGSAEGPDDVCYGIEGSVFVAGAAIQWLADLGLLSDPHEAQALGERAASTEGVVFVPALTGLGAPHWDPDARGLIAGITRGTRREHLVRAGLEAIAFQTHDVVRAMEADIGSPLDELRVGGGAAGNDLLCQFQSDILGMPVVRPRLAETTALGAAFAAGLAVGTWRGLDEIAELWEADRTFRPKMDASTREARLEAWRHAVRRCVG